MVDHGADGDEVLITLAQAAMWLRLTPRTLQRWTASGLLESVPSPRGALVRVGDATRVDKEQRARRIAQAPAGLPRWGSLT